MYECLLRESKSRVQAPYQQAPYQQLDLSFSDIQENGENIQENNELKIQKRPKQDCQNCKPRQLKLKLPRQLELNFIDSKSNWNTCRNTKKHNYKKEKQAKQNREKQELPRQLELFIFKQKPTENCLVEESVEIQKIEHGPYGRFISISKSEEEFLDRLERLVAKLMKKELSSIQGEQGKTQRKEIKLSEQVKLCFLRQYFFEFKHTLGTDKCVADGVICLVKNENGKEGQKIPVIVIQFDGYHHQFSEVKERDEFLDSLWLQCGVYVCRLKWYEFVEWSEYCQTLREEARQFAYFIAKVLLPLALKRIFACQNLQPQLTLQTNTH